MRSSSSAGAIVENVTNEGLVTTLGHNDMVLDNWGDVQTWTAQQPITSRGSSGVGFVNFSDIKMLMVQAPIQTYGKGCSRVQPVRRVAGRGDL